ncbi:MAG: fibronectin type III domain-containing protein, partial [Gemmatimonadetes bacterium]|nr:fibronectin type III domain-containing protein [Gemmatimonadota bacterium]
MKTVIACLGGLILAGTLHAAESYSCGPFLLDPGPDRMTVVIDHEKPVTATLTLSGADGGGKKVIEHGEPARHHLFVLEGLEPGAEYRYEVKTGRKHGSGRRSFRTLPEDPEQYRLIALGDVRSQPHIWHKVAQRIFEEEQEALFIIGTGDYPADGRQYGQWIDQFFVPAR